MWSMIAPEIARSPLQTCLDQLQRSAGPPPAPDALAALSARLNSSQVNLQSCGRILERDFGLSLRLLRTVNSALFNHGGATTFSVTHAAALLGTDALVQLIDTSSRQLLFSPVRELVALSHLTAALAGSLMARHEPRSVEEASVSALFRNIGEICFALDFPGDYDAVVRRSLGYVVGLRAACRSLHHLEFDELSAGLLNLWSFHGAPVLAAQSTPESLFAQHGHPESDVALAASLAHVLATAYFRCESAERDKLIRPCLPILAQHYHLRDRHLPELCGYAAEEFEPHLASMGLQLDQLRLRRFLPGEDAPDPVETAVSVPPGATLASILRTAIDKGVDRAAWLSYREPDVRLEAAAGDGWPAGDPAGLVPLIHPRKPPFLLAFGQRQDVWIDFAKDNRFLSTPLAQTLQPAAFFLLPVYEGRRVRGCLYFDWAKHRDHAPETILPALTALRDVIGSRIAAA